MLTHTSSILLLLGLTLGACLDRYERGEQPSDPDEPEPSEPDPSDPSDPSNPSEPDPNDPDPNEPDPIDPNAPDPIDGQPPESRAWCLPEATPATPPLILPVVPPEALDRTCPLEHQTVSYQHHGETSVIRFTWAGDDLWAELAGDPWNLMKVSFDGAGTRRQVLLGRAKWNARFEYAASDDLHRYRWDADGHLTEYAILRGDLEHIHLVQRWQDGRLVERMEERSRYDAGAVISDTLVSAWRYEGARIVAATASGLGHHWSVAWHYDEAGRPVAVERQRDGVVVQALTWAFDDAGRLARRTVMHEAAHEDGFDPGELDSLGQTPVDDYLGDPWVNAVPREAAGGCLVLPTSLDFGYPGDDDAYQLGTPRAERPSGIGWAYGADTYGWNYGNLSWYSHAGVHGLEPRRWGQVQSDIRYAAGVMVAETVTSRAGPIRGWERQRTFAGSELVSDRAVFSVAIVPAEDPEGAPHLVDYGRELHFVWAPGETPRLIQRELHDDARGLLEWQTWERDESGRWLAHSVHGAPEWGSQARIPLYHYERYDGACGDGCAVEPVLRFHYARRLDDAGRTVELVSSRAEADGALSEEARETWRYDAEGRLIEARSGYGYTQSYSYDAAGNLVREAWDYDGVGVADGWTAISWDTQGRWVSKETWSGGALHSVIRRVFGCP